MGDWGLGQSTQDANQFVGKKIYDQSELNKLRETVSCKQLSDTVKREIMEQAVAPCPKITMPIKGHRTRSLLDLGSEVTLVIESYFKEHIEPLIPPVEHNTLNAHNLFILRG